ncbi:unnamed protein product [Nezara viridula]|uniref:CD80-like immunoglobulin C2-set domain-containing protein n=1 Tax=Nezara viridula TaxID=85310 RepID=A0A9P0EA66_NEZVI|nr:unnamed protein product [Nezara viridula]
MIGGTMHHRTAEKNIICGRPLRRPGTSIARSDGLRLGATQQLRQRSSGHAQDIQGQEGGPRSVQVQGRLPQLSYQKLQAPSAEPKIYNPDDNVELKDIAGPYRISQDIRLVCIVSGGNPTPNVSWWLDKKMLESSSELKISGNQVSRLHLGGANKHLHGRKLSCQAKSADHPELQKRARVEPCGSTTVEEIYSSSLLAFSASTLCFISCKLLPQPCPNKPS